MPDEDKVLPAAEERVDEEDNDYIVSIGHFIPHRGRPYDIVTFENRTTPSSSQQNQSTKHDT